jgi:hypothetical protein
LTVKIKPWTILDPVQEIFDIEPLSTCGNLWKQKKVNRFKRKTKGKTYENPRIILGPESRDLVGRKYHTFRGRAVHKQIRGDQEQHAQGGDVILLFFPDVP